MSLILEALRKSEAERRRGQMPDLHAELPPATRHARPARSPWPWLALAVVTVVAMAWLARGLWLPPSPAAISAEMVGRSPSPTDTTAAGSPAGAGVGSISAGAKPEEAAAPALLNHPTLTTTSPSPGPVAKPPTAERGSTPMTVAGADTGALPVRRPDPIITSVATQLPPATVVPLPSQPAPVPAGASAPTPTVPAAVLVPTQAPGAVASAAPLRLSDLSAAERLELPALKMSMHMWGPTPGERFAILDGTRVNEGDRLGDAVVEEITARAVVLAWRGRRLQIPVR